MKYLSNVIIMKLITDAGSLPADEGDSVLMNDSSGQLINDDNEEHNAGGSFFNTNFSSILRYFSGF